MTTSSKFLRRGVVSVILILGVVQRGGAVELAAPDKARVVMKGRVQPYAWCQMSGFSRNEFTDHARAYPVSADGQEDRSRETVYLGIRGTGESGRIQLIPGRYRIDAWDASTRQITLFSLTVDLKDGDDVLITP